jgi:para-aminobenzoate synthetase component 1
VRKTCIIRAPWREPVAALSAFADEPWTLCLLSDGERGRWSYLAKAPDAVLAVAPDDPRDPFAALVDLVGPTIPRDPDGPPFQGGIAGLASYELGDRVEQLGLSRMEGWPDLACARYPAVLAFDHQRREVLAIGPDETQARAALAWLDAPPQAAGVGALAAQLWGEPPARYEAAVAEVTARIAAGEIFQANIARRWRGALIQQARPFDLFVRLAEQSPAPYAAYLRLPGQAIVSNSPERFLKLTPDGVAESRPIKGTASRGRSPAEDACRAEALARSQKDRAENLMIVDLMRNDLARVSQPGSVSVPQLCAVETFANVHHLVSTVQARLREGVGAADLLSAAFPAGSITGAPKVQAMKVIAHYEAPRGPFFGSMFFAGFDGSFDSSVLIRTIALTEEDGGWTFEARAGGGIVADSSPVEERRETEAKIAALLRALG